MVDPNPNALWHGLVGYTGDPGIAYEGSGSTESLGAQLQERFEQLDRSQVGDAPRLLDFGSVRSDTGDLRRTLDVLAALDGRDRGILLVGILAGDSVGTAQLDSVVAEAERLSGCGINELMAPLLSASPVPVKQVDSPISARSIAVGCVVASCALAAFVLSSKPSSTGPLGRSSASPLTIPAPTELVTTQPLADLVSDSERVVSVAHDDDGLIVRVDPLSGVEIRRSGPFSNVAGLRVDANTVTVERGDIGRLYLNLVDGTQLPP